MKSYIWAHEAVNTRQLRQIPLIMVSDEDTHHLLYYRGEMELFFFLHCRFCEFLFRILTHAEYAWLYIQPEKSTSLYLFPPSPNTHICLSILLLSPFLPHPFLCFSSALATSSNWTGRCSSSSSSTNTVFPKRGALQLWGSLPQTDVDSVRESIIKLADVGMNLRCMCTAEPSLQSEFLKLYCWGGIEGSCCPRLKKGNTAHSEEIELYAYEKVRMREKDRGGLTLRWRGEFSWTESLEGIGYCTRTKWGQRLYFLWR